MAEMRGSSPVGPLTAREVVIWGNDLKHIYSVPEDRTFDDLLRALGRAASKRQR
jgi:hypothetical protein